MKKEVKKKNKREENLHSELFSSGDGTRLSPGVRTGDDDDR